MQINFILHVHRNDDLRQARYEVQELQEFNNARPFTSGGQSYGQRPPFIGRPGPASSFRPLSSGEEDQFDYNLQASGNEQFPIRRQPPPPAQSVGILTGPVPSWEKPTLHKNGDPTNFDHCKCSFSFNCKSPGIQFVSFKASFIQISRNFGYEWLRLPLWKFREVVTREKRIVAITKCREIREDYRRPNFKGMDRRMSTDFTKYRLF